MVQTADPATDPKTIPPTVFQNWAGGKKCLKQQAYGTESQCVLLVPISMDMGIGLVTIECSVKCGSLSVLQVSLFQPCHMSCVFGGVCSIRRREGDLCSSMWALFPSRMSPKVYAPESRMSCVQRASKMVLKLLFFTFNTLPLRFLLPLLPFSYLRSYCIPHHTPYLAYPSRRGSAQPILYLVIFIGFIYTFKYTGSKR